MNRVRYAVAASIAVLAVAGCSGGESSESAESYSIDSWQNWGRAGVEWMEKCEDYGWGCVDDQMGDLMSASEDLPADSHSTALRPVSLYQETFRKYVERGCTTDETPAVCATAVDQLDQLRGSVHDTLTDLAAGGD
ncbi:hypothetical protein [Gordonia tangerina]|uniref:Lipoprotein n=1 Tax=Gordonia tangerina TaxID=2911060 RepID=A0ABS9DQ19_9ACTN|nr:hypothetical protein [Gordonia tangerina]MCF3941318.1 hypothetical protein [Gordonia tangerina]